MKTIAASLQYLFASTIAVALPILSALLCLLPQVSLCSQEFILEPIEVSIRADAGEPFGEVSTTICASGRDSERRISDIKLRVGSKSVRIPERAYSDLESPLLVFQVGFRTSDGQWHPKRVHIAYHAGRIESRSIETPNADGSSTRKEDIFAGTPLTGEDARAALIRMIETDHKDNHLLMGAVPYLRDAEIEPEEDGWVKIAAWRCNLKTHLFAGHYRRVRLCPVLREVN